MNLNPPLVVALLLATLLLSACSPGQAPLPNPSLAPEQAAESATFPPAEPPALLESDEPPPIGAQSEFKTDFSKHTVPYSEILSGGPPKDGIPSIDSPQYVSVSEADAWLAPVEPVVLVRVGAEARAYPIQILMWHEIVNDTLNGKPLLVTFCPLCNTAIAFERVFDGQTFDFGTTGRLRYSNLIMYDRQTETWWQQATGDAIAGEYAGAQLPFYPASIVSWADFKAAYPNGTVLSRETGHNRSYGRNPYLGYDDVNQSPFLYRGQPTPGQLVPMARVLTLELGGEAVAYPYDILSSLGVINDTVGGQRVVVFWVEGTASALDSAQIPDGRDVGATVAYSAEVDGQTLTFELADGVFRDKETASEWDIFGRAVSGKLQGAQLTELPAINHFWFSWAAFRPETRIYQP
ncbi:MAG: DUF3179 domain-containing protein [Candidatus Latescibacteria bacterium]|nr:DUF3179 domain-containing protein [Candidatus Latescibacterota bacterium]